MPIGCSETIGLSMNVKPENLMIAYNCAEILLGGLDYEKSNHTLQPYYFE